MKGNQCTGQKIPKERLSILLAANMDGSQKLPLVVIGKFEKLRCMNNIRSLPVMYKANKKAWMTGSIFEEWLRKLDRKFLLEGRNIALIVDNCSAHPRLKNLRAVKLIFLPSNTTSVVQPCDQRIIQNFKCFYRKRVLRRFMKLLDEDGSADTHYKLAVLDAINYAAASWDEVKQTTIANYFKKAGFTKQDSEVAINGSAGNTEDQEMVQLFNQATKALGVTQILEEYVEMYSDVPTTEHLSLKEITANEQTAPIPLMRKTMMKKILVQSKQLCPTQKQRMPSTH